MVEIGLQNVDSRVLEANVVHRRREAIAVGASAGLVGAAGEDVDGDRRDDARVYFEGDIDWVEFRDQAFEAEGVV